MPQPLLEAMPYTRDDRLNGVQGLAHALQAIGTLLMMCDARDLGVAVGENLAIAEEAETPPSAQGRPSVYTKIFEPNIYLYDKYPGGIGFSEPLFRLSPNLLENTRRLILNCPCESGCPSCVGPVGEVGEKGKEVALAILGSILDSVILSWRRRRFVCLRCPCSAAVPAAFLKAGRMPALRKSVTVIYNPQ